MMSIGAFTDQADARAETEARRHRRIAVANRVGWPELPRRNLAFEPFGGVVDERNGDRYQVNRGEIDADYRPVAAYYIDPNGDPVFLEKRAKR